MDQVIWIKLNRLHPSKNLGEEELEDFKKNFKLSDCQPVKILRAGENIVVTDGHKRILALMERGYKYIPTLNDYDSLVEDYLDLEVRDFKDLI